MDSVSWLIGLIEGDGYIDDRHIEIYNSSESILKEAKRILCYLCKDENRIKLDIYFEIPDKKLVQKWSRILSIKKSNIKLKKNLSPWKQTKEKLRLRICSKELASRLSESKISEISFLKGLFDAEASVDVKGYIEFKQIASKDGTKLTKKLHAILKRNGIECNEPKTKNDRNIKTDVYFYVKDIKKFQRKIGFVDETKNKKLKIIIEARKKNNTPSVEDVRKMKGEDIWKIVEKLNSPYHKIRKTMIEMS